jgi:hypothetical protein
MLAYQVLMVNPDPRVTPGFQERMVSQAPRVFPEPGEPLVRTDSQVYQVMSLFLKINTQIFKLIINS